MSDVLVTVPERQWRAWLAEGDLVGSPESGAEHYFRVPTRPQITPGERVYIVALGRLRGYAPLVRLENWFELMGPGIYLVRRGGAEAVTIPAQIRGFQGYRYRFWDRDAETPFPNWQY